MKILSFCLMIVLGVCCLVACEPEEQAGGGQLPEHGIELITEMVKTEKRDDSGGRIVYVENATSTEPGETLWCVNIRFVNSQGVLTTPLLVSQRGEEWRIDRNPDRAMYEGYGCVWP